MEIINQIAPKTASETLVLPETGGSRDINAQSFMIDSSSDDLAGGESVKIEYTTDSGLNYKQLNIDGVLTQLDVDNNVLTVVGKFDLRVVKSATAASVGVIVKY